MKINRVIPFASCLASLIMVMTYVSCSEKAAEDEKTDAATTETTTTDTTTETGTGTGTDTGTGTGTGTGSTTSCTAIANTTATATLSTNGCALLTRDVSSCKASREAQGLTGFWLKFSCTVTLTRTGNTVKIATNSIPDNKSYYYNSTDVCYSAWTSSSRHANPNKIASQTISMTVPFAPTVAGSATATPDGAIGVALNGVAIFDNTAAPGDDIYTEEATFDICDGHPERTGKYHYHSEPTSISNTDDAFVGVLRDGFPVYGRNDKATGAVATGLDAQGGKTGITVDSPTTGVYHYHTNLQTNGTASVYFLTKGAYSGTPGACTGCL